MTIQITANHAKTHFGEMLLQAQRHPVCISKNGKPTAVVLSTEDYNALEAIKQALLEDRIAKAREAILEGKTETGGAFMKSLVAGEFD